MKQVISPLQLAFLLSNFIFTAALITLPQIMIQVSRQYTWLVPLLLYPVILLLFFIAVRKTKSFRVLLSTEHPSIINKGFNLLLLFFLVIIYIRDLRALIDFIKSFYLPKTPAEILAIVLSLTLIYVAASGLETLARITVIHTFALGTIILLLPIMLLNEIDLLNLIPIITTGTIPNILKSSYLLFPWLGEAFIFLFLLGNLSMENKNMKAIVIGVSFGMLFFWILLFLVIAVLGEYVASLATYPNIFMIQEIHLTDFLDRLDLVIVIIWAPCLLCRVALILFCVHRTLTNLKLVKTNLIMTPLGLFLGILSIVLFKKNMVHTEFTFFTWPNIGILFELLILGLFLVLKYKRRNA